jgi:hypothetical protein
MMGTRAIGLAMRFGSSVSFPARRACLAEGREYNTSSSALWIPFPSCSSKERSAGNDTTNHLASPDRFAILTGSDTDRHLRSPERSRPAP